MIAVWSPGFNHNSFILKMPMTENTKYSKFVLKSLEVVVQQQSSSTVQLKFNCLTYTKRYTVYMM